MGNENTPQWGHGQKAELARRCDITPQYLNDLIHGRKSATPERARQLTAQADEMGLAFTRADFLYPRESRNPLMNIAPETRAGDL